MSYADIHPVHSPYSPTGGGPVSIEVGGLFEEEEVVSANPYDEEMEWDIPSQQDPRELGRDRSVSTRDESSAGWTGSEMEWETTSHEPGQGSSLILCLDTNTLIRHLPLIIALHSLLLTHSASSSTPPPISFLISTVVLGELDGLKSSRKPVQSTISTSSPSIHASTIGTLAQRANHWLLDQKRKERVDGFGRGIFFARPPPSSGPATNDDRILQTALLVRAMPSSSGQPPQIVLWTSDVNFSLQSEASGVETMGSGSRMVPRTPIGVLQFLGFANDAPPPPPPRPSQSHHLPPPPSSVVVAGGYEGGDGMEIDDDAVAYSEGRGGAEGALDSSARGSFRRTLEGCVPLALDRRLADIRKVNSALLDNAGLPSEPPPRSWRLDKCFDALSRIWGNDKGRWEGRDLGVFLDRRTSSLPSTPSSPTTPSNVSIHAPRTARPPPSPSFLSSSPHPPSPKHVREVLLPILSSFFSVSVAWAAPSEDEWVEVLKAVEIVLGGPGGRRFLGDGSWKEVLEGIEKGWEEVKVVRRREMGFDD